MAVVAFKGLDPLCYFCRHKRRLETKRAKLGILEAVEEVGVDTFLSDRESTPGSLPSLEGYHNPTDLSDHRRRSETSKTFSSSASKSTVRQVREDSHNSSSVGLGERGASVGPQGWLSDFDARYLGALDDFDELEDIEPGFLTTTGTSLNQVCRSRSRTFGSGSQPFPNYLFVSARQQEMQRKNREYSGERRRFKMKTRLAPNVIPVRVQATLIGRSRLSIQRAGSVSSLSPPSPSPAAQH